MTEIEKLKDAIIALISAGESMTDTTETCGHDCVANWLHASRKAKALFHDYETSKKEIEEKIRAKRAENFKKKEEQYAKKT